MPKNSYLNNKKFLYTAALILENGQIFWGQSLGAAKTSIAELCFNTSITGYQEILTDPSYAKQIINFTFPHIGIVGTNENDLEANKPYASGCIISNEINKPANWRSRKSLHKWLIDNNIPCITNIDTRYITKILATEGAQKAALVNFKNKINIKEITNKINNWGGLQGLDLALEVSTKKPYSFNESKWDHKKNRFINFIKNSETLKVVCMDYGIKKNILRSLNKRNLEVIVLPANSTYKKIMSYKPKGIFLSNGPGDPFATSKYVIPEIKMLIEDGIPIFGICLGHQILSLALGAKTKKMYRGHRGANHPVKNLETEKVEITTQNHGFEVLSDSLPKDLIETHISLFDKSNEGVKHIALPIFSVQYHPEASPGPHDSQYLFDKFYKNIKNYAKKN